MDVELVVTDLDGTLWHVASEVHERTRRAIERLQASTIPVLVATGRRVGSTRRPLEELGIAPPAVVLNGALGLDLATGSRFHLGGFMADDAASVLNAFLVHNVEPCIYIDDDEAAVWVSGTPSTHPQHLADFGPDVSTGDLVHIVQTEHVLAFSVLGIAEKTAMALGDTLAAIASPHIDRDRNYGGFAVTVAPATQSKWDGVESFCRANSLDSRAVLAIGDGPNDVDLLDNAAIAVVPEDAHPSARAHADHVVGCAADGGWADILDLVGVI